MMTKGIIAVAAAFLFASIEDHQVALAPYRAACERWPGTPITLRHGARAIEDSRRLRTVKFRANAGPFREEYLLRPFVSPEPRTKCPHLGPRLLTSGSTMLRHRRFRIGVGDGRLGRGEVSELDPMLPREFLAAPAHPPARLRRVLIAVHVVEAVHRVRALGAQDQRAVVAQEQRNGCRHQALDGRRGCRRRLGCQRRLSRRGVGHRCFGHGREMAPAPFASTHSGENILLSLIWNPILIDRFGPSMWAA